MIDPKKYKVIQLVTPGTPIFAVYVADSNKREIESMKDLHLEPCPVVALIEEVKDGRQFIAPIAMGEYWLELTEDDKDCLGVVSSVDEARKRYLPPSANAPLIA